MAICNACDWCRFCDIRFYLQQNKITKILNEKSRRKIFVRVENSVYITWHRHRIIFSFLYFFLRLIVVWGPPTETAYKKTVGLAAVLLCASNRGRSQTAVLKLIISRPPLFLYPRRQRRYAVFLCLVHALNLSKKAQAPDQDILILVAKIVLI